VGDKNNEKRQSTRCIEVFKEVDYVLKTWWTVYNEMEGKLSRFTKMGKMVLFHKKGDREDLANYRPITMLNSDYKIVAKVLANRLQKVIGNLIDESQTGFVRERWIEGNIMEVYLVCKRNRQKGAIVLMDFEKCMTE
jgi:Reverse transcriptase (RNA-dependent DNA polymerase)